MSDRHRAQDAGDGTCAECGQQLFDYGRGGLEHKRGRHPGVSKFRVDTKPRNWRQRYPAWKLAILRSEDSDRCECGTLLSEHPPLPRIRVESDQARRNRDDDRTERGVASARIQRASVACVARPGPDGHCLGCGRLTTFRSDFGKVIHARQPSTRQQSQSAVAA